MVTSSLRFTAAASQEQPYIIICSHFRLPFCFGEQYGQWGTANL